MSIKEYEVLQTINFNDIPDFDEDNIFVVYWKDRTIDIRNEYYPNSKEKKTKLYNTLHNHLKTEHALYKVYFTRHNIKLDATLKHLDSIWAFSEYAGNRINIYKIEKLKINEEKRPKKFITKDAVMIYDYIVNNLSK